MKKFKKIVTVFLLLVMVLGCFSACKSGNENSGKITKLTMYLLGEKPKNYDQVLIELNKLLVDDLNAELEVKWIANADVANKYPMILSSGEEFDLIFTTTSGWVDYRGLAAKNAFLDITDLAPKYAPETYESLSKEALNSVRVNGKIYCLPCSYIESNNNGMVVRGDLRKKYNCPEINSFDDFITYLDAIKKNEPNIVPFNATTADGFVRDSWTSIKGTKFNVNLAEGADPLDIRLGYEADGSREMLKKLRDCYLKGYWPKDILVNKVSSRESFLNGTSGATMQNINNFNSIYATVMETHPEWEPEWYIFPSELPTVLKGPGGVAVSRTSKNPEKALQLLELLNQDERYFDLTTYGIKDKDYVLYEDGKIDYPEGVTASNADFIPDNAGNWGWRNPKFMKYSVNNWPNYQEKLEEINSKAIWSIYDGFTFDVTNVKAEATNVATVIGQYSSSLGWGLVDVDETVDKMMKELKAAGLEKYRSEVIKQAKEFLNANK